jgi:glycosyltransferase involved in cell wall biosynthesis
MITYNHEKFIDQAIDSALNQVTDFPFQLVIGEDGSTDATRKICELYQERYPDKILLLPKKGNLGMMKNFLRSYRACEGKYIAFLEGDDYWTDSTKLQKQVDFLEANEGYSACFHNVVMKNERLGEDSEWNLHTQLPKDSFNTEDVLGPWFVPSLSFVFVNYPDFLLPEWFFNCKYGDLPFMLLLSLKGNFKYINEVMGVYRLHDTGLTTKDMGYDKIIVMVYIYECFNIHTAYKYKEKVREAMIYEISRHVPKEEQAKIPEPKTDVVQRVYRRIKGIRNILFSL